MVLCTDKTIVLCRGKTIVLCTDKTMVLCRSRNKTMVQKLDTVWSASENWKVIEVVFIMISSV